MRTGPGLPGLGKEEGLLDGLGELGDVLDQVVVLGTGAGNAHDVHFLKGVVADEGRRHLPGDDHHRDGVHVGRGYACHRIGCAGARRYQAYPYLTRGPRVAVGHVDGALLVAYQHVL